MVRQLPWSSRRNSFQAKFNIRQKNVGQKNKKLHLFFCPTFFCHPPSSLLISTLWSKYPASGITYFIILPPLFCLDVWQVTKAARTFWQAHEGPTDGRAHRRINRARMKDSIFEFARHGNESVVLPCHRGNNPLNLIPARMEFEGVAKSPCLSCTVRGLRKMSDCRD